MCTQCMYSHNLYLVALLIIAVIYFLSARMYIYNETRVTEGFEKIKYTPIKVSPLPLPDLGFLMKNPLQSLIDFFNRLKNFQDLLNGVVDAYNKAKALAEKGYRDAVAQYNNATNSVNDARNKMNDLKNKAAARARDIDRAVKDRARKVANQAKSAGRSIERGAKSAGRTISRGAKKFFR